ncbi:MAG TPA: hypothetical protein DHV96_08845 [Lachnospiraceae bacterium]|nr:hypothetical protein [Lachnospiraceae bacterium]
MLLEHSKAGEGRANAAAVNTYGMLVLILEVCYLIEVIKGSRSIPYYIVFSILALVPYVMCLALFRQNREAHQMKYVMAVGFGVFYLFIIFTTISPVAYVYAIMMAVILLSYDNIKLILGYMIGVCVGNVVQVAYQAMTIGIASEDMPNVEIRVASLILFGLFMVVGTMISDQNNRSRMEEVEKEKERTAGLNEQILHVSEQITENIQIVADKMKVLEGSSTKTKSSMEEVAQGTGETVESIQLQMEKTEQIQNTIKRVQYSSDTIHQNMDETQRELAQSQRNINDLIEQVQISNEANADVSRELEELYTYTNQMQSIVQMINDVTEQTSLLALNASIEAARAGEAGKGFAVVASEISALATQTQQATVNITNLINNISTELSQVVEVIHQMMKNVEVQNQATGNTARSFEQIAVCIEKVGNESRSLAHLVVELSDANSEIIRGIETISAATEEVTAHSSETLEASEENNNITNEVSGIVDQLHTLAQDLANTKN